MPKNASKAETAIRKFHIPETLRARYFRNLHAQIIEYINEANNVKFHKTDKLVIRYGQPEILATGYIFKRNVLPLVEAGFLRRNPDGTLALKIDEALNKDNITAHLLKMQAYCRDVLQITKDRDEEVSLCDERDLNRLDEYATYPRGLDICGFAIETADLITLRRSASSKFRYAGIFINRRHSGLARQEHDSLWDVTGGVIDATQKPRHAIRVEAMQESNIQPEWLKHMTVAGYVHTNRKRGKNGIIRERRKIFYADFSDEQAEAFACNETKGLHIRDSKGRARTKHVPRNVAYPRVSILAAIRRLPGGKWLRNGKRMGLMLAALHAGIIPDDTRHNSQRRQRLIALLTTPQPIP